MIKKGYYRFVFYYTTKKNKVKLQGIIKPLKRQSSYGVYPFILWEEGEYEAVYFRNNKIHEILRGDIPKEKIIRKESYLHYKTIIVNIDEFVQKKGKDYELFMKLYLLGQI